MWHCISGAIQVHSLSFNIHGKLDTISFKSPKIINFLSVTVPATGSGSGGGGGGGDGGGGAGVVRKQARLFSIRKRRPFINMEREFLPKGNANDANR